LVAACDKKPGGGDLAVAAQAEGVSDLRQRGGRTREEEEG